MPLRAHYERQRRLRISRSVRNDAVRRYVFCNGRRERVIQDAYNRPRQRSRLRQRVAARIPASRCYRSWHGSQTTASQTLQASRSSLGTCFRGWEAQHRRRWVLENMPPAWNYGGKADHARGGRGGHSVTDVSAGSPPARPASASSGRAGPAEIAWRAREQRAPRRRCGC